MNIDVEKKLVSMLFETQAVRVCPKDEPFWYTSGTLGPYYINTHFLYGSENTANSLLSLIDTEKENILACPRNILKVVRENYHSEATFRTLIDIMCERIHGNVDLTAVDFISGGERRDWFFSLIISEILNKPHLAIYKDLAVVMTVKDVTSPAGRLEDARGLHIADLITEASSYERAWIPAIEKLGAKMTDSLVVVDRMQGGSQLLASHDVTSHTMVKVEQSLFETALKTGYINKGQYDMVTAYLTNPKEAMGDFLKDHPGFLQNVIQKGGKDAERAKLCIEKNLYELEA